MAYGMTLRSGRTIGALNDDNQFVYPMSSYLPHSNSHSSTKNTIHVSNYTKTMKPANNSSNTTHMVVKLIVYGLYLFTFIQNVVHLIHSYHMCGWNDGIIKYTDNTVLLPNNLVDSFQAGPADLYCNLVMEPYNLGDYTFMAVSSSIAIGMMYDLSNQFLL